jgi:disulfide bond formation protein DsbB
VPQAAGAWLKAAPTPIQLALTILSNHSNSIRQDWLRVWAAGEASADMPSWCSLGLQRVRLDLVAFEGRWLAGGVLAHFGVSGGRDALRVHVPRAFEAPVTGA